MTVHVNRRRDEEPATEELQPAVRLETPPIRLYRADCLTAMTRVLEPASVSVVVTSPPYNLGIRYDSYDDARPRAEYLDWIEHVARQVRRVLEPTGSFFLNVGGRPSDPWPPLEVAARVRRHFVLQNTILWVKSIVIDGRYVCDGRGQVADDHRTDRYRSNQNLDPAHIESTCTLLRSLLRPSQLQ